MTSPFRHPFAAAAILLLAATPLTALAQGSHATSFCPGPRTHSLPKSTGSSAPIVIRFGVQGGSLRPWTVQMALDGSITASGITAAHPQLADPRNALRGLLALADAVGFFSMKKALGCLPAAGNPDVSTRFISIRTSGGTKRVSELGSCAATSKYDQLYAVLREAAGMGI